jgi:uncharacterized membrane protein YeaQ/YmgE (transglycosylase-associated protein family)
MSIIVFILIGVAVFALTHRFCSGTGVDIARDLCLGVTGAVTAGMLLGHIGTRDAPGLILGGMAGATMPLAAYHVVFRELRSRRYDRS